MVWNGVHFNTHTVIPWQLIAVLLVVYVGAVVAYWAIKRPSLTTRDTVYMGLVAALLVIYHFFLTPLLPTLAVLSAFFDLSMIGMIYLLLTVASLVGKPGAVGLTIIVYDLLGDLVHYGFGGEPFWIVGDAMAYAMILDIWLIFRDGGMMTAARGRVGRLLPFLDGALGGVSYAISVPLFFMGFWGSFVHGFIFNPAMIEFRTLAALPEGVVFGLLVTPFVVYTKRIVKGRL